ncbi:hypothetical protein PG997_005327 [Apiospora hydei]|uniref:Uncharacterized protein n=1 Tax=Apiospora hydei TaxID=1337664 RepID=A0ABR1X4M9_9PEZI
MSRKDPLPALSRMPNELWLVVQGDLDPIDRVALALTLRDDAHQAALRLGAQPRHKGEVCKHLSLLLERVRPTTPAGLPSPDFALCQTCRLYRPTRESYWVTVGETYAWRLQQCYYREAKAYGAYVKGLIDRWRKSPSTEVACPGCRLEASWDYFKYLKGIGPVFTHRN